MAILPAQACPHQCLWESSPFMTVLSTNLVTNMFDRSDNRSCPSVILVVFRKRNQTPPAMVRPYYALYFCTFTREADLVVAGGHYLYVSN